MRDDAQALLVRKLGELVAATLAVDDDPLEAAEEPAPEISLSGGAPRKEVVSREDERLTEAQEPVVQLRGGEPLEMSDVGAAPPQAEESHRVLDELHRDPEP